MTSTGPGILAEIRARHAVRDACSGHVFRSGPTPGRWTCEHCGSVEDAGYVGAYYAGMRVGATDDVRAWELIAQFEAGK